MNAELQEKSTTEMHFQPQLPKVLMANANQ